MLLFNFETYMRALIAFLLFSVGYAYSASYYTTGTGNWETNTIWGTTTNGAGSLWSAYSGGLVNGDQIYIDDNITLSTNLNIGVNVTIYLSANLYITGKLMLTASSTIVFTSSGSVTSDGSNSNQIQFGAAGDWNGSQGSPPGTLTGPGTLQDGSNGVLPVELKSFEGKISDQKIELVWTTLSEINFNYFNVEKSSDGELFSSIGTIAGHGTTHETNQYLLIDQSPLIGKNYYRLKSVDFDGYTETFKVISVTYNAEKRFSITPNPSDGFAINFKLNFVPEGGYIIAIYDNLGHVINRLIPANSEVAISYDRSLSSGVYFAKLITEDFVRVERFVVK
jgi:hypothetical protein